MLLCLLLGLLPGVAGAAEKGEDKQKTKKNYTVSPPVFKRLDAAQQLLAEDDYAGALAQLDALGKKKLNPHEQALMWQIYGYTQSSQERYGEAIKSFEKCIAEDALPASTEATIRYNLGQLYMAEERFEDASKILETWLAGAENPAPSAYYLIAIAYTQQDRYEKALSFVEQALAKAKVPNESWLQLALSLYFQLERWTEVAETLEVLVTHFPKASYWKQLTSAYASLGKERKSLAALELAYAQGFLVKESELENLAHMYLYHEVPYKAARVVEKALEEKRIPEDEQSWELLANSWLHAREYERALDPLERAASLSEDGDVYIKLAQLHLQQQRWSAARKALEAALAKGELEDPGGALILAGITSLNEKRYAEAKRSFTKAKKYEKNRKAASDWLEHVEREIAKNES
ncbi:MAG: tetratricopeptide repeat protein [Deltaproteobacteria bacterium]|nr:tetratricopeptide repeat protein [Deltaproteobacteria bacterium]